MVFSERYTHNQNNNSHHHNYRPYFTPRIQHGNDDRQTHRQDSNQQGFCTRDPNFVCVVDPYSRKLEVPRKCMLETLKGIGISSLCMLFLEGRCRAGSKCHQAHVDPEVIEHLRREALASPTCCCKHGDSHSAQVAALIGDRKVYIDDQEVPAALFAGTLGLQRLLRDGGREGDPRINLPPRLLCRLHLANKCRYVEECNPVSYTHLTLPTNREV